MQQTSLLHVLLKKQLINVHKARLNALIDATHALLKGHTLTLAALGRNVINQYQPRSNIKRIDRLLGNKHLHDEICHFYQAMAYHLIPDNSTPWIHVDWSCICAMTQLYVLRASLSMKGRSIVIYEESHLKSNENNHTTHKHFLNNLKAILPHKVKPVIVTDAGFRAPWFQHIYHLGWDFVGRLRHKNLVLFEGKNTWILAAELSSAVIGKPRDLGRAQLTRKSKVPVNLVIFRGKNKNRHKINCNKLHSRASKSLRHSRSNSEPWLLATSLTKTTNLALSAVNIYRQRMRIEENFRDTKSGQYGFGLNASRTRSPMRMSVLLLIAALATFLCWLTGLYIEDKGTAASYQAQSSKFKNILSYVYLGKEAIRRKESVPRQKLRQLLERLVQMAHLVQLESIL